MRLVMHMFELVAGEIACGVVDVTPALIAHLDERIESAGKTGILECSDDSVTLYDVDNAESYVWGSVLSPAADLSGWRRLACAKQVLEMSRTPESVQVRWRLTRPYSGIVFQSSHFPLAHFQAVLDNCDPMALLEDAARRAGYDGK